MTPMPEDLPDPADEAPLPQLPEAAPVVTTSQAIKDSVSARAMLVGIPAGIYKALTDSYEWFMGFAKEAGPEIVATKTAMGPFDALVKMTPTLALWLTIAVLCVVFARKIADRKAGTSV
jgi:hypothetical protein